MLQYNVSPIKVCKTSTCEYMSFYTDLCPTSYFVVTQFLLYASYIYIILSNISAKPLI